MPGLRVALPWDRPAAAGWGFRGRGNNYFHPSMTFIERKEQCPLRPIFVGAMICSIALSQEARIERLHDVLGGNMYVGSGRPRAIVSGNGALPAHRYASRAIAYEGSNRRKAPFSP